MRPQICAEASSICCVRKAEAVAQEREAPVVELLVGEAELLFAELFAQHELVEDERQFERAGQCSLDARDCFVVEALCFERRAVDVRRFDQRAGAFGVGFDRGDLLVANSPSNAARLPPTD